MKSQQYISDKLADQINVVKDSRVINMFDMNGVQREAQRRGYYDLVLLVSGHPRQYVDFILTGKQ